MTLPRERLNAIRNARLFLTSLLYRDVTPRVPKAIREQARSVLKHFVWTCDQETIESTCSCGVFVSKEDENNRQRAMRRKVKALLKKGTQRRRVSAKSKLKK